VGESGTGKELVARAIYKHSRRADKPFLAINCAAIPESLLESELFGHEKGAFTGADRQRIGKFEQANGGTIFLDEIGDMAPLTQSKILRLLQEQKFERVGGNQTITTDVRIIAATHRPLERLAAANQFRSDLYYRLSVFGVYLPALREHLEDLPLLVEHFLRRFSREMGKEVYRATPEVLDLLRRHPWPGNIRELQSTLKQALLRTKGSVLLPEFLPVSLTQDQAPDPASAAESMPYPALDRFVLDRIDAGSDNVYAEIQQLTDERLLSLVLEYTGGNQLRAARILGITRGKLRAKLRALGIHADRTIRSTNGHVNANGNNSSNGDDQAQAVRAQG
jgi:two-component system nitrogen regulation response regulator GlnG